MPGLESIVGLLDQIAPLQLAADWDNVGLLLGDAAQSVERILTCLTVTHDVVEEAIAEHRQLIVAHHPILFRGTKRLTASNAEGRIVLDLARHGIAVYSAHTAYDNASNGVNDQICDRLKLTGQRPLRPFAGSTNSKIVVFVPTGDLEAVSIALFEAGAGRIGHYDECGFRVSGQGTFRGNADSNPTVGKRGQREDVAELRLEVVCPAAAVGAAISALRKAHSYEEPAFDVYPLSRTAGVGGEGRVGQLPESLSLQQLVGRVRDELRAGVMSLVGDPSRTVRTVALACGAAGEFLDDAVRAEADVFVTGELRFHSCLEAEARGLGAIVAGHYATERFAMETLADRLRTALPDCDVMASQRERDPCQAV